MSLGCIVKLLDRFRKTSRLYAELRLKYRSPNIIKSMSFFNIHPSNPIVWLSPKSESWISQDFSSNFAERDRPIPPGFYQKENRNGPAQYALHQDNFETTHQQFRLVPYSWRPRGSSRQILIAAKQSRTNRPNLRCDEVINWNPQQRSVWPARVTVQRPAARPGGKRKAEAGVRIWKGACLPLWCVRYHSALFIVDLLLLKQRVLFIIVVTLPCSLSQQQSAISYAPRRASTTLLSCLVVVLSKSTHWPATVHVSSELLMLWPFI